MQRRKLDFHDFDSVAADLERLQKNGYSKAGNWGLRQICQHLEGAFRMSIDGFSMKGPWIIRKILGPYVFKGRLLSKRSMPEGFKAPKAFMPSDDGDETSTVQAFKVQLDRVRDHKGEFQPNPFLGPMTPDEWRQFHLIHAAHHLSFLIPKA